MNPEQKKVVIPIILVVIILIVLVFGATYAYFTIDIKNNSTTTTAQTSIPEIGSSALVAGDNLSINLTRDLMMKKDNDIPYYATVDGTPSTSENKVAIATANVTGNNTMDCEYALNVLISGDMYTKFKELTNNEGQMILNFAGQDYDLATTDFTNGLSGILNGITKNTTNEILASFKIVNRKDIDQNSLTDTSMTISFTVKSFTCNITS